MEASSLKTLISAPRWAELFLLFETSRLLVRQNRPEEVLAWQAKSHRAFRRQSCFLASHPGRSHRVLHLAPCSDIIITKVLILNEGSYVFLPSNPCKTFSWPHLTPSYRWSSSSSYSTNIPRYDRPLVHTHNPGSHPQHHTNEVRLHTPTPLALRQK